MGEEETLLEFTPAGEQGRAEISIEVDRKSPYPVNPLLFGKFCEHLGSNIYNGMEAQILRNPTFGKWVFGCGTDHVNGGAGFEYDPDRIAAAIRSRAARMGWPDAGRLVESYQDGCAYHWFRIGGKDEVLLSPDAGAHGNRAQRIETTPADRGIGQWTPLPLHRVREFEYRVVARSASGGAMRLRISTVDEAGDEEAPLCEANVPLARDWTTTEGSMSLPEDAPADGMFLVSLLLPEGANVVLDRVLLYPSDHVNGADPDVIRFLKEARLPLLRWPGGNFVSGYRWKDGMGPVDSRPTVPNPAWGALEYNLFGTDEFMAFCREVGCEPMICINAGDGTPEEAAEWVEYCNGSEDTEMGGLRAQNGHPEPYNVRYWEIGNEISGRHQVSWTTSGGNVDRYLRFTQAMRAVDPDIDFLGCGAPWGPGHEWNRRLVEETGGTMRIMTDHILAGGTVEPSVSPEALFDAFMAYPEFLGKQYREQRKRMEEAGIGGARLAITELQLFARLRDGEGPLARDTMPTPATISEALYHALIVNECIRMGGFVEMITHSATVNHGGGLRKTQERVWANPCHYGLAVERDLSGGIPVAVRLSSPSFSSKGRVGSLPVVRDVPVLDAMAVLKEDGALCVLLVHRSSEAGPLEVAIDPGGFEAAPEVDVVTLSGGTPYEANTPEEPERVIPLTSTVRIEEGKCLVTLQPFSLMRLDFKGSGA